MRPDPSFSSYRNPLWGGGGGGWAVEAGCVAGAGNLAETEAEPGFEAETEAGTGTEALAGTEIGAESGTGTDALAGDWTGTCDMASPRSPCRLVPPAQVWLNAGSRTT